ncbi:MAG TPA: outer membrane protein assembly factor BamD [Bacteroidales bacterium]|nr:outer membrane protein assembly factor BamD [Bacteroidales bacterium]
MQKMRNYIALIILLTIGLSSCSEYYKIQKSSDHELKFKKAVEYYKAGKYLRTTTLLEELIHILKGGPHGEEAHYVLASAYYDNNDYIMAGHYFSTFLKSFPNSSFREEAEYKTAYCFYLDSPRDNLDQSITMQAIDAFGLFKIRYPESKYLTEVDKILTELKLKVETKAYKNAFLYYEMGDYKAATVSLRSCLKDYPTISYREDLLFYILKSDYTYAAKSIDEKQEERFLKAIKSYRAYSTEFSQGKYIKEAESLYKKTSEELKSIQTKAVK